MRSRAARAARWSLVACLGLAVSNSIAVPLLRTVSDLADEARPAGAPRMVVDGPRVLAVGWTVESGPHEGVYLRRRSGLEWEPAPIPLPGDTGAAPRDIAVAPAPGGGIHVAWTAMLGEHRQPWFATLDAAGLAVAGPFALETAAPGESSLEAPADADADADADFPAILPSPEGGALLLWQSGSTTHFTVESARIAPGGSPSAAWARLPSVSGESLSALAPQPLRDSPPTVAYYEVLDAGNRMRVALLDEALGTWRSAAWPGLGADVSIPFSRRPSMVAEFGGVAPPIVCRAGESLEGGGEIRIARGFEDPAGEIAIPVSGEVRQPHAAIAGPAARTVAFQRFDEGAESIGVVRVEDVAEQFAVEEVAVEELASEAPDAGIQSVTITSPETRFASDPFHASHGQWTAIVWLEERPATPGAEGTTASVAGPTGDGPGVGFAEIYWNLPDSVFETRLSAVGGGR